MDAQKYIAFLQKSDTAYTIEFTNNTDAYVEVIFVVDGRELRRAGFLTTNVRGYGIPPKTTKKLTKLVDGAPLPFKTLSDVRIYMYAGEGRMKPEDLDIPAFIRKELVGRVYFKRTSEQPMEVSCAVA